MVVNTPLALVVPLIVPNVLSEPLADSVTAVFGDRIAVGVLDRHRQRGGCDTRRRSPLAGLATSVDVVAEAAAPATNVTDVVSWTLPSVAVIVSVCAKVEARVVVNTPLALVVPLIVPNVLSEPLADSVTAVFGDRIAIGVLDRHRQRGGCEVPSAVTVAGLATSVDVVAAGGPATSFTTTFSLTEALLPAASVTLAATV